MDTSDLHYLKNFRNRASYSHVTDLGSDEIVIYKREYQALEEAIKELEKKEPS